MPNVLITGAAGQLGHDLVNVCRLAGDEVTAATRAELDVGDSTMVADMVRRVSPDVIINCAAWTAVDACEADPDRAHRDNALAARWLRQAAEATGSHLVQISTDYVFDGTSPEPYLESDLPNPQSVYGMSKLAGENEAGEGATIVRTSWVCGRAGNNMVKTVLRLLASHPTLTFVSDQIGNPSFTADLAPHIRTLALEGSVGVHHLTNSTPGDTGISWYGFVRSIVAAVGKDPSMVQPISTADLTPARPAPRPANSVLANTRTEPLRDYREALDDLLASLMTA